MHDIYDISCDNEHYMFKYVHRDEIMLLYVLRALNEF